METERRTLAHPIEVRADDDGPRLVGYAAVYGQVTEIAGYFREQIAAGAFDEAIGRDDVRALFNHSPDLILGRTAAGTLHLSTDGTGLRYEVQINEADPQAVGVLARVKRGDVDGSSFAFQVDDDEWEYPKGQLPLRTIRKVHLYDVSPVTYPAYAQTSVSARAEARAKELAAAPDAPVPQAAARDDNRRRRLALAERRTRSMREK